MAKRLGIIPHRYAQPVFHALRRRSSAFELYEDHAAMLAVKLRENHLAGAFLSPIDYAREYQMYRIVPGAGVASDGASGSILLLFREHLRDIRTLAVDPRSGSEIVLAHLVFAEKYREVPQIVPVSGIGIHSLDKADAALLVGDDALAVMDEKNKIDLVEEWNDITGLPFVQGVWVSRERALSTTEMNKLVESAKQASDVPASDRRGVPAGYLEGFRYSLTDQDVDALTEFFRMAYYHGVIKDIPDVKLHLPETEGKRAEGE